MQELCWGKCLRRVTGGTDPEKEEAEGGWPGEGPQAAVQLREARLARPWGVPLGQEWRALVPPTLCGCCQEPGEKGGSVGGHPCFLPSRYLSAKALPSLASGHQHPANGILPEDHVSRFLRPLSSPPPPFTFAKHTVSKAFSPPASLVISPPHFP